MLTMQTRGAGRRRDDHRGGAAAPATAEPLAPTSGQLRSLAAHQHTMLERERRRIAQEIHDELGGSLTGIRACLASVIQRCAKDRLEPDPLLADACALAIEAMRSAHRIAMDLSPSVLNQLGIWAALEWYLGRVQRRNGIVCDVDFGQAPSDSELGDRRVLMIFRIVQEALTNVERHAHAKKVSLRVFRSANLLTVTVTDDGVGCDPSQQFRVGAMGWFGMVERARQENGTLTITSQPGQGTAVVLVAPLEEACHG
ncbi:MAG: sensor histidine kinase [Pseudomonadota bacterium]